MDSNIKVVILGLTNSGKSTIGTLLKKKDWPVLEVDDEAQRINNNIWPEDEAVLDVLFKQINQEVLQLQNIIFITSFLEIAEIKKFHTTGFKIIEIHAKYEELQRRKIQRDGFPEDNWKRFDRNYYNYQDIISQVSEFISLSLDTTDTKSEQLTDQIEMYLNTVSP